MEGSFVRLKPLFAVWFGLKIAPLHPCFGMEVESPAFRRASSCAADLFDFVYKLRPDWTIPSGWVATCSQSLLYPRYRLMLHVGGNDDITSSKFLHEKKIAAGAVQFVAAPLQMMAGRAACSGDGEIIDGKEAVFHVPEPRKSMVVLGVADDPTRGWFKVFRLNDLDSTGESSGSGSSEIRAGWDPAMKALIGPGDTRIRSILSTSQIV